MATFTQTATYNQPVLVYPALSNLLVSGSLPGTVTIPLLVTRYTPPVARSSVNQLVTMPVSGAAIGNAGALGVTEFYKTTIEGTIDTPTDTSYQSVVTLDGIKYHYADLISLFLDGRATATWVATHPTYFRDPYGRQFNNPKIIDFAAGYVEGVPGRTTFNITLQVL